MTVRENPDPPMVARRRYATLDGMRGVAALFVVMRHFSELRGAPETVFSYLAVDVFFLLSGFVLSLSYAGRFARGMTAGEFLILRAVRLLPLYLFGITLALAFALRDAIGGVIPPGLFAAWLGTAPFMLPSPSWERSPALFPIMPPAWSLFFEFYVANILFAALRGRPAAPLLAGLVAGSALLLAAADFGFGSLDIGQTWPTLAGGVPRVCFSFFGGMLLQQLHQRHPPRLKLPSWIILAALAPVLSPPLQGMAGRLYEAACVFAVFPALVFWGAEAIERQPRGGVVLGDVS